MRNFQPIMLGIMSKRLSYTGHRPKYLNGYNPTDNKKLLWKLHDVIVEHIEEGYETHISGMALGIDMFAARIVIKLKEKYPQLKLIAAVPCKNQFKQWPKSSQDEWHYIIERCDEVVYVSDKEYTNNCMQLRNIWMVENSDKVLAVWNGSAGGTGNCIKYAQQKEKQITIINPKDFN